MGALERFNSPAKVQRIGNDSVYGTGSDGTAIIASNISLSRDMYYSNLTINSGFHLNTNGYRVFVKNTLTLNGSIGVVSGVSVSNATVSGTSSIASNTTNSIGGSAFGATYTASQLPTAIIKDISTAVLGYYIDTASNVVVVRGGAGGGNGIAGTVTPGATGTVSPGYTGAVHSGQAGGAPAGYMAAPTTWPNKDNTYGYHAVSRGAPGNYSPGLTGQGQGYPGGPGPAGTPGTNGAAGSTPSARAAGTISAAVAGSTPPAASAGVAGIGGAIVVVVAKTVTGTGSIFSQGSNSTAGGGSAIGTGAGPSATSSNAGAQQTGSGATNGAAGSAGAYVPPLSLHHGSNDVVHWNRTVAPAHHVAQTVSPLARTGHQPATSSAHAHGYWRFTTHDATPVHPANSHHGSSPHQGSASTSHAAVPAVSGYFHKNSVDHNAGGHLGHNGAVAHPYNHTTAPQNHNHYSEADHHASGPVHHGAHHDAKHAAHAGANHYHGHAAAHRGRHDLGGSHSQGVYAQAGTNAHHTAADFASGQPGPAGSAGSAGTNGIAYAGGEAHTSAGTNGSTTAGTAGQSGGGGGIIIITETTLPVGITTNVNGGALSGNTANSGSVITILNT
jgi:hypothetical protein